MILNRLKAHSLYLMFLSILTLIFLAEKAFLIVPFMQYILIILYALSLLLTLLITVLFGNKDKPFYHEYYQKYPNEALENLRLTLDFLEILFQ